MDLFRLRKKEKIRKKNSNWKAQSAIKQREKANPSSKESIGFAGA